MSVIETLMNSAIADTDVLRRLDADNDRFEIFRDVDFHIVAKAPDKAKAICGFITDYQYGVASIGDDPLEVRVVVHMPVTQSVILSVSGFMNCLAALFDAELDGWGCVAQSGT